MSLFNDTYDAYRYWQLDYEIYNVEIIYSPLYLSDSPWTIDSDWRIKTETLDENHYFLPDPEISSTFVRSVYTNRYEHTCENLRTGVTVIVTDNRLDFKIDDIYNAIEWYNKKKDNMTLRDVINKFEQEHEITNYEELKENNNEKETSFMTNNNFMNGMFGKIESGKCRLSVNGQIAIQTTNGYKTYNIKTGRLTNCNNFVFDIGDDFFFVIPTNKVKKGDIIIVAGKPKCVIDVQKEEIKVINFENSTIDTIIPERHMFMGNVYFYGKIVSMFGQNLLAGKKGTNKIFQLMMMREMFGKNGSGMFGGNGSNGMSNMLPFLMMGNTGLTDMFSGMFDEDDDTNVLGDLMAADDEEDTEDETEEA